MPLPREHIASGTILWFRKDVEERDPETFAASGIPRQVLGHPVLVVEDFADVEGVENVVWLCRMSSRYKSLDINLPIMHFTVYMHNRHCDDCHSQGDTLENHLSEFLRFEDPAVSMSTPSHVNRRYVYEVSYKFLVSCNRMPSTELGA